MFFTNQGNNPASDMVDRDSVKEKLLSFNKSLIESKSKSYTFNFFSDDGESKSLSSEIDSEPNISLLIGKKRSSSDYHPNLTKKHVLVKNIYKEKLKKSLKGNW